MTSELETHALQYCKELTAVTLSEGRVVSFVVIFAPDVNTQNVVPHIVEIDNSGKDTAEQRDQHLFREGMLLVRRARAGSSGAEIDVQNPFMVVHISEVWVSTSTSPSTASDRTEAIVINYMVSDGMRHVVMFAEIQRDNQGMPYPLNFEDMTGKLEMSTVLKFLMGMREELKTTRWN